MKKGKVCLKDELKYEIKKLGIFGVGMMGVGIVYVFVKVGMEVVLKDVIIEGVEKGKVYFIKLLDKVIKWGWFIEEKK